MINRPPPVVSSNLRCRARPPDAPRHLPVFRLLALLLALALPPLPCFGEALSIQPTTERFILGFSRMAAQLQEGHGLSTLFTVSPGYLPIADRNAANALRQMLAVAQFGYLQRGAGEENEQSLQIWAAGESALTLTHRTEGGRRLWSSPQLLPEGISTPMELNLFAELLGQAMLGEMVFAVPSGTERFTSLQRLLAAAGTSDFALAPEVANRMLDECALVSGWRVAVPVRVSHMPDERGGLASFQLNTQVIGSDGRMWNLDCKGSRGPGKRQYEQKLNVTLSRDKSNTLQLAASVTATEQAKDHLRQALKLTYGGKLNGHNLDLRLNGTLNNRFLMDGAALVEQIDGSYTLDWKTREPALARLGLDEWKVTLGVKGALRSEAALAPAVPPALFEGSLSLVMTRSRKDFLSTGITFRASAREHATVEAPGAALLWEALGDEEQEQLDGLRALLRRQVAGKLMAGLDTDTRNGLWLK